MTFGFLHRDPGIDPPAAVPSREFAPVAIGLSP